MRAKSWFVITPGALALLLGGSFLMSGRSSDGRIADSRLYQLEQRLGRHLYAPAWLPHGGRTGIRGAVEGRMRILQDFTDSRERVLCILSQEERNPERDAYHRRLFVERPDARGEVGGTDAYFVNGTGGDRRLFWFQNQAAIILSSNVLSDEEMLKIAASVR